MKSRKQAKKHLEFYSRTFRIQAPFQVICDANFIHHFVSNKLGTSEDLIRLLSIVLDNKPLKLVMCESSMVEIEHLLGKSSETYQFSLSIEKLRCGKTEKESLATPPPTCMKKLIGTSFNRKGYFVATLDEELKDVLRAIPGVPILYFNRVQILLDAPSAASMQFHAAQEQKKLKVPLLERRRLEATKQRENQSKKSDQPPSKRMKE